MKSTVLLTGFSPFAGEAMNSSWEAIKELKYEDGSHSTTHLVVAQLPCTFDHSFTMLEDIVKATHPQVIICTGQAGGRREIGVERVAINCVDARIPDEFGKQPIDEPVIAGAPVGYWSTLPIKAIVHHLRQEKIPATVSNSAGTFVCNALFYRLMHYLSQKQTSSNIRAGFIHLPYLSNQGKPGLDKERLVQAIHISISTVIQYQEDMRWTDGALY